MSDWSAWIGREERRTDTLDPALAARWLAAFVHYYNFQRPNQALDNRIPVEEVLSQ